MAKKRSHHDEIAEFIAAASGIPPADAESPALPRVGNRRRPGAQGQAPRVAPPAQYPQGTPPSPYGEGFIARRQDGPLVPPPAAAPLRRQPQPNHTFPQPATYGQPPTPVAPPPAQAGEKSRLSLGMKATLAALALAVGVIAAVWGGTPLVRGEGWDWLWLAGGAGIAVGGGFCARQVIEAGVKEVPKKHRRAVVGIAALTLFALVGSVTTPVIDGEPVLTFSKAAKVKRFADEMQDQIRRFGEIDRLLDINEADARLRVAELEDAYKELADWNAYYSKLRAEDLPSESLVDVELLMERAVSAALRAIDLRLAAVKSSDPVAQASAEQWRRTYIEAVLQAAQLLDLAAREYGITIAPTEEGAVE